jgi:hypothetical protein
MRGYSVTEQEIAHVLRLIRYRDDDDCREHTKSSIGKLLGLDPRTVEEVIWSAAEREGIRTQWRPIAPEDP